LKRGSKETKRNKYEGKIKNKIQTKKVKKEIDKTWNKNMKDGTGKGTYKREKRPFYYNYFLGGGRGLSLNIVILTLRAKR